MKERREWGFTNVSIAKISKITITPKITKIINQGNDNGKYNKSLKESRERGFTDVTKTPNITITAKITKITNQGGNTGKYDRSLKESRSSGDMCWSGTVRSSTSSQFSSTTSTTSNIAHVFCCRGLHSSKTFLPHLVLYCIAFGVASDNRLISSS